MKFPFVPRSTYDLLDRILDMQTEALHAAVEENQRVHQLLLEMKREGYAVATTQPVVAASPLAPLPPIVSAAVGSIPMSESERVQIETQCRAWLEEGVSAEEVRRRIYDGEAT